MSSTTTITADTIGARELSGENMDDVVSFEYRFMDSKVHALVTGAIREVHHDGMGVTVWLTAHDRDTAGDKAEFCLVPDARVTIVGQVIATAKGSR